MLSTGGSLSNGLVVMVALTDFFGEIFAAQSGTGKAAANTVVKEGDVEVFLHGEEKENYPLPRPAALEPAAWIKKAMTCLSD